MWPLIFAALHAEVTLEIKARQSLQAEIDQRENEICALRENIAEMESSLRLKSQQEQTLLDNNIKIEALEQQIKDLQDRLKESEQGTSQVPSTPFVDITG